MVSVYQLLKRETELVLRFRDTLLHEQEILRTGSSDGLAEVSAEKLSLVEDLNSVGAVRAGTLSAFSEGISDMDAWLLANPQDVESASLWKNLLTIAREAREINESNGRLINVLYQKTSDALVVLTQNNSEKPLYSNKGQSSPNTGTRIIDSA